MEPAHLAYYVVGACIVAAAVLFLVLIVLAIKPIPKVRAEQPGPRKTSTFRFVAAMLVMGTLVGAVVAATPWLPQAQKAITHFVATL